MCFRVAGIKAFRFRVLESRVKGELLVQGCIWGIVKFYGPFLGPYYNMGPNTGPNLGDPKRDHNFDNPPFISGLVLSVLTLRRRPTTLQLDLLVHCTGGLSE